MCVLRAIRVLFVVSLSFVALLPIGAFRADAQAAIDDLDTGAQPEPVCDASALEFGADRRCRSERTRLELGRASRGPLAVQRWCWRVRTPATRQHDLHAAGAYDLVVAVGSTSPRAAFHTNGADDVWVRGFGDSSAILTRRSATVQIDSFETGS